MSDNSKMANSKLAMIYQCAFCGSYSIWEVGNLEEHGVQLLLKATTKKLSQKDIHNAELEFMNEILMRKHNVGANWLPCSFCLEHYSGWEYGHLIRATAERPGVVVLPLEKKLELLSCPFIPVVFEDVPPMYRMLHGKWTLAQGVGPKSVEVIRQHPTRLPASQFKVLLKGKVATPPVIEYDSRGGSVAPQSAGGKKGGSSPTEVQFAYREFLTAVWNLEEFEEVWNTDVTGDVQADPSDEREAPSHPELTLRGKAYMAQPVLCVAEDTLAAVTDRLRAIRFNTAQYF